MSAENFSNLSHQDRLNYINDLARTPENLEAIAAAVLGTSNILLKNINADFLNCAKDENSTSALYQNIAIKFANKKLRLGADGLDAGLFASMTSCDLLLLLSYNEGLDLDEALAKATEGVVPATAGILVLGGSFSVWSARRRKAELQKLLQANTTAQAPKPGEEKSALTIETQKAIILLKLLALDEESTSLSSWEKYCLTKDLYKDLRKLERDKDDVEKELIFQTGKEYLNGWLQISTGLASGVLLTVALILTEYIAKEVLVGLAPGINLVVFIGMCWVLYRFWQKIGEAKQRLTQLESEGKVFTEQKQQINQKLTEITTLLQKMPENSANKQRLENEKKQLENCLKKTESLEAIHRKRIDCAKDDLHQRRMKCGLFAVVTVCTGIATVVLTAMLVAAVIGVTGAAIAALPYVATAVGVLALAAGLAYLTYNIYQMVVVKQSTPALTKLDQAIQSTPPKVTNNTTAPFSAAATPYGMRPGIGCS